MPTYENLPAASEYFKGKLYQKMVDDLRLAGKAKRTVYTESRSATTGSSRWTTRV